nr:hypothetical protein [Tanacetum cinerariifolium]
MSLASDHSNYVSTFHPGDKVDWDANPMDSANVKVNSRGHVRLGKWASIFEITGLALLLQRLLLRTLAEIKKELR